MGKKCENPTSNTGNTGIGSSNSKCNAVDTKILEPPDKNENKKIGNNVEFNGDNSSEMPELHQQKCENAIPIAIINDMTHAGKNKDYDEISGGTKTVTNTETNCVTTNIEGNNGEEVEAEAEAEAETEVATNNSNNSNTAIITVQLLEEQVRKMKILETRIRAAENNGLEKIEENKNNNDSNNNRNNNGNNDNNNNSKNDDNDGNREESEAKSIDVGAKYDEYFDGVGDGVGVGVDDGDGVGDGVGDGDGDGDDEEEEEAESAEEEEKE